MPVLSAAQLLRAILQDATISVGVGLSAAQVLPPINQQVTVHLDPELKITADQQLEPMTQTVRIKLGGGFVQAEPRAERGQAVPRVEPVPATERNIAPS